MNYQDKYKIAADLIKKGYLIHCTDNEFEKFEPSKIAGWPRAKEGYGFYFSDMPYKPLEYGNIMKVVKKDEFNFLDSSSPIDYNTLFGVETKLNCLNDMLYNVRNNREYDEIQSQIDEIEEMLYNIGGRALFSQIEQTIRQYDVKTYGQLEYYMNNPQKWVPRLVQLYIHIGYDGYETDGIYTIFNFNKLNSLVKTINFDNYNMNESLNVSSFEVKDTLNPDFWRDEKLDSRIRLKLLDIADDFTDSLNVDWVKPDDIIMTGSLANYNWSVEHSDIDLHIIIDFKKVDERVEFVKEYFDSKKKIWNQEHQNIKIYGFPVELYVQDKNEKHASTGIYSIEQNKWIVKPNKEALNTKNLKSAKTDAESFADKIDDLIDTYNPDSIESNKEKVLSSIDDIIDNVKNLRKNGFSNGGTEMNRKNLAFKILRRNGYLDKMYAKKNEIYDDLMSINEDSFGSKVVKNKKLYTLLKNEGLEGIILCKGYGYFYIDAITPEMQKIIYTLKDTSIYLNSFNQQPVEMWVQDIKDLLTDTDFNSNQQKENKFRIKLSKIE